MLQKSKNLRKKYKKIAKNMKIRIYGKNIKNKLKIN